MSRKTTLSLALVCSFGFANETIKLDEIEVVSASGYAQQLIDAPASISVIKGEDLQKRPVKDIGEMIEEIPGVDTSVHGNSGLRSFNIRGFGPKYTLILIDGKRQNAVDGMYSNGMDATASAFMPPVGMIERVEVIKGPASTLYGSEAVGGVVNIITKKHPNKPTGSIQVEGGLQQHSEYGNSWGTSAFASTPVIDDVLSFGLRFGYYTKEQNDVKWPGVPSSAREIEKAYGGPGEYKNLNFGLRLDYSLNENNHFYLDYDHTTNEIITKKAGGSVAMKPVNGVAQGARPFYYKTQKDTFVLNHDGTYNWGSTNSYLQYNHMYGSGSFKGFDSKMYTAESKAVLPFSVGSWGDFITTFGLRFDKEELYDRKVSNVVSFEGTKSQKNLAVYAENEWLITNDLIFTTGLRYLYNDIFGSEIVPRVYLVYHANDYLTLKGGVAKGYKTPSPKDLNKGLAALSGDSATFGNPDLKPESSINYELGMNINIPDIMNISLTGFITDFKDEIKSVHNVPNGTNAGHGICDGNSFVCRSMQNLNKTQTKGIEIGINTAKFNGFSFDASYTYIDKKNKTSGKNYGDVIGDVPRQVAMAKINYEIGYFSAFFKARARLDHINTGRGKKNVPKYKDFYAFDLGMQYKINENQTINFVVNNIFDKEYIEPVHTGNRRNGYGEIVPTYTNEYSDFTDRRNFWLSYRYDF
ncbi:TonB-dependent receptor domain-containing protein [Campylobacter corcagiensis]|uniref:TonB-dependent receptor n=1 Tax=Campylobacter corcagiensis TaxID=1448857 RepID=A0A7M1LHM9_9BACT|nr:TonB-dependent receptor [Campylobacter corcagiensis]QKF65353.1 TonB-dependent siderophore receptor [Campylobacter corcagiensis]QOQ88068.1 TonB-dependent receptor [Campylobacter corcagiensis]